MTENDARVRRDRVLLAAASAVTQAEIRRLSRGDASRAVTPEGCFRHQTLLVHAWRKLPFLDPDLPAELLPPSWPHRRAHGLFVSRHERWGVRALQHFQKLEAGRLVAAQRAA